MFENLTNRLQDVFQKIKKEDTLTRSNVNSALLEVRKALLEADVSLKVIKLFLDQVRKAAIGERVVEGINASDKFIEVVNRELVEILGGEPESLLLKGKPAIILMLGLQGVGKTTTSAKLALNLKKQNKKTLLVALDLRRPAAIKQLQVLGKQTGTEVFALPEEKDVLQVAQGALQKAYLENFEVLIFDTAGRLQADPELMAELLLLERKFKPAEKLLVIDALIGQEAAKVAQAFQTQIGITGCILSKLDGDSRGGAALSLVQETGKKIKFTGVGEKIEALKEFDPVGMASRILGFGDILALVKEAEDSFEQKELEDLNKNIFKGNLNFDLFAKIQKLMRDLGGLSNIALLLGIKSKLGSSAQERDALLKQGENNFKEITYLTASMTKAERKDPSLLTHSHSRFKRIERISKGSAIPLDRVKSTIQQFEKLRSSFEIIKRTSNFSNLGSLKETFAGFSNKKKKEKKKQKNSNSTNILRNNSFFRF